MPKSPFCFWEENEGIQVVNMVNKKTILNKDVIFDEASLPLIIDHDGGKKTGEGKKIAIEISITANDACPMIPNEEGSTWKMMILIHNQRRFIMSLQALHKLDQDEPSNLHVVCDGISKCTLLL